MSITNAEHHRQTQGKGEWRSATVLMPCSRYFGGLSCCKRAITPGQRYFNTQETVPDAGLHDPFVVCANCANASYSADFLKVRAS